MRAIFSTILKPTFPACVAMAQEFQEPASLSVVSTAPIPPNPWCPDLTENEAVGAAIFLFHPEFSKKQMVYTQFAVLFGTEIQSL